MQFIFDSKDEAETTLLTLNMVCKHISNPSESQESSNNNSEVESTEFSNLTESDWKEIYANHTLLKFKKGDRIIKENDVNKESVLYLIHTGTCVEEKIIQGQTQQLLKYATNETIGELSFLFGGRAITSIVADSDEVEIIAFKGSHLKNVFHRNQSAGARFFKSMADILAQRLRVLQS